MKLAGKMNEPLPEGSPPSEGAKQTAVKKTAHGRDICPF
jgi:hypothetical protein